MDVITPIVGISGGVLVIIVYILRIILQGLKNRAVRLEIKQETLAEIKATTENKQTTNNKQQNEHE